MSFCNYCSDICESTHICNQESLTDILLNVVGGEIGLVQEIMSYKLDLEKEEMEINFDRFGWLEIYTKIKTLKVVNNFENKLEFYFTPNTKFSKTYHCEIELKKPIILSKNKKILEDYLGTFDIPLAHFYNKRKTNYSMEIQLKIHIRNLNKINEEQNEIWDV